MNKLKKIGLAGLVSLLLTPSITKAENVCTTYENYYFFVLQNGAQNMRTFFETADKESITNVTYFPNIPDSVVNSATQGRVCLSKNGVADGSTEKCSNNTWTLEEFYNANKSIVNNGTIKEFEAVIKGTRKTAKYTVYSTEKTSSSGERIVTSYYKHGSWYKQEVDGQESSIAYGGEGREYPTDNMEDLENLSVLLTQHSEALLEDGTSITFTGTKATITRNLYKEDYEDAINYSCGSETACDNEKFVMNWGGSKQPTVLVPALYRVTYRTCEDLYKATIQYFVKDKDGVLIPASEYEKSVVDYSKKDLPDKYEESVETPKITGCTADKSKVNVKINGSDFADKVVYTCKANQEVDKNAGTGDALIYLAWAVGLGAIGYSVYYFRRAKKEEI